MNKPASVTFRKTKVSELLKEKKIEGRSLSNTIDVLVAEAITARQILREITTKRKRAKKRCH